MNKPVQLQSLVTRIMRSHPAAEFSFDPLPSGVCFLRVGLGRRNFVLEFHPTEATGVSENFDDTPPFVGHDEAFDSLDAAIMRFEDLLADAEHTEAGHLPKALVMREENLPWKKST